MFLRPASSLLCWTLLASVAGAAPDLTHPPIAGLVAAERAFAARAQEIGARDAFAEHFASDALWFAPPGPVFPALTEGAPWGIDIRWRPVDAGIARSGDFGWTTGPAEYRKAKGDAAPFRWGYYTSVWMRQPDGRWKVAIDGGITVPQPTTAVPDWSPDTAFAERRARRGAVPGRVLAPGRRVQELLDADRALAVRASRHAADAFGDALLRDARVHSDGRPVAVGRTAALGVLRDGSATYAWTPAGARVAASGDLGFSYGSGEKRSTTGGESFHYLAIWEKRDGRWRLGVLVHAIPKPKPAAG